MASVSAQGDREDGCPGLLVLSFPLVSLLSDLSPSPLLRFLTSSFMSSFPFLYSFPHPSSSISPRLPPLSSLPLPPLSVSPTVENLPNSCSWVSQLAADAPNVQVDDSVSVNPQHKLSVIGG